MFICTIVIYKLAFHWIQIVLLRSCSCFTYKYSSRPLQFTYIRASLMAFVLTIHKEFFDHSKCFQLLLQCENTLICWRKLIINKYSDGKCNLTTDRQTDWPTRLPTDTMQSNLYRFISLKYSFFAYFRCYNDHLGALKNSCCDLIKGITLFNFPEDAKNNSPPPTLIICVMPFIEL